MKDNKQPEALRLANVCSNLTKYSMEAHLIAAELRRLHAENAVLQKNYDAVQAAHATVAGQCEDAIELLGKYKDLCEEIKRGDSYHLGRIDAAISALAQADSQRGRANGEVVGWLPVHSNGHKFYGAPLKTEVEAKQYINQVHQSSDSVTLIARPFTWIATPPTQAENSLLEDAARYRWLRNKSTVLHNTAWLGGATAVQRDVDFLRRDDALAALDAAIDTSRKQGVRHDNT